MLSNFEPSHDHQNIHHMKEFYIFVVKKSLTDQKMKTWVQLKKIQKKIKNFVMNFKKKFEQMYSLFIFWLAQKWKFHDLRNNYR